MIVVFDQMIENDSYIFFNISAYYTQLACEGHLFMSLWQKDNIPTICGIYYVVHRIFCLAFPVSSHIQLSGSEKNGEHKTGIH